MKLSAVLLPALFAAGIASKAIPQPDPNIVIETTIHDDQTPAYDAAHGVQEHTKPSRYNELASFKGLKTLMTSFIAENNGTLAFF